MKKSLTAFASRSLCSKPGRFLLVALLVAAAVPPVPGVTPRSLVVLAVMLAAGLVVALRIRFRRSAT
jgi:hypothetical protein